MSGAIDIPIVDICVEMLLSEDGRLVFHPRLATALAETATLARQTDPALWTRAVARLKDLARTLAARSDGAKAAEQLWAALEAEAPTQPAANGAGPRLFEGTIRAPAHDAQAPTQTIKAHRWMQPGEVERRRAVAGRHRRPGLA